MTFTDILSIMGNTAVIYLLVLIGLRILGKKDLGQLSVTDILFIMLVSEVVGDVMRASHDSLLSAVIAAATLVVLNRIFNVLMYRSKKLRRLVDGLPVIIIHNGNPDMKEMKKARLTISELEQACREQGHGDISAVKLAVLEVDGKISVLKDGKLKTSEPVKA